MCTDRRVLAIKGNYVFFGRFTVFYGELLYFYQVRNSLRAKLGPPVTSRLCWERHMFCT